MSQRRSTLRAVLAGVAALAVALTGGVFVARQHAVPFASNPLTASVAAEPKTGKPATPKKHVAPAPVLTGAQVAKLVSPGVVVINSNLTNQNAVAAGTGMLLTAAGEILTNNHVIDGASSVSVTVFGGRRFDADVVGTSPANDVAVLQLRGAAGLATVPLADSDSVTTGTSVIAIGNAGGTGTLSVVGGTVTSTSRTITASDASGSSSERLSGMIEVRALIRAGDSGGPLSNRAGKVIGMDTAASAPRSNTPGGATFGFAIPINRALAVAQGIRGTGSGGRGYLGIEVQPSDPAANEGGALVIAVTPGSPASAAGIRPGDTITDVQTQTVTSSSSLTQTLQQTKAGQQVRVGWLDAGGLSHHATVTLASGPAD